MDKVFAFFENDSDGYTYSSETLLGVFHFREEAEQAILERVELHEWYDKAYAAHLDRRAVCIRADDDTGLKREDKAWKLELTNRGIDPTMPDLGKRDVESYEIEELTVGKLRW
jgi:hypothetical protein